MVLWGLGVGFKIEDMSKMTMNMPQYSITQGK